MKDKYENQRRKAKARGIEWLFTFESWIEWWNNTGKLSERGRKSSEFCMCRIGDNGPYSVDNVYCATNAENLIDALKNGANPNFKSRPGCKGHSQSDETRLKISLNSASKLSDSELKRRIDLYNSMDMTKWGALGKYAKAINVSHTQARRFITEYIRV